VEGVSKMKSSPEMRQIILDICQKYNFSLDNIGAYLKLEMESYMPLVIEKINCNQVSVAHYYYQNGDAIADPDILFITVGEDWIAAEISQPNYYAAPLTVDGSRECVWLCPDQKSQREQAAIAELAQLWAENLRGQGWLEGGRIVATQAGE